MIDQFEGEKNIGFVDIPDELQRDPIAAMEFAKCPKQYDLVPLMMTGSGRAVPDQMAVVDHDGHYLGVVGRGTTILQPDVLAGMAKELIDHSAARLEKIIKLHDGATIGLTFHLHTIEPIPGDATHMNFLLLNNATNRLALQGRSMGHRVFCSNQIATSTKLFSLKHTKFVSDRVKTALLMLKYYDREVQTFQTNLRKLVAFRHGTVKNQLEWFERTLLPEPREDDTPLTLARRNNILTIFVELLENGQGVEYLGSARGTGWHTLNALTEYVNHHRTTRVTQGRSEADVRWQSVTLGTGDKLMQRGFKSLLQLAQAA